MNLKTTNPTLSGTHQTLDLTRAFTAVYFVGFVLAMAVIVLPAFPPLQDYWEWMYHAVLINELMANGSAGSPVGFWGYPIPNAVVQAFGGILVGVVPVAVAAKVTLLIYLFLSLLVFRALLKIAPRENAAPAMVILFAIFFGSQFFNGYINNVIGNLILALFVATILRRPPLILETLAYAFILFFCHATSFVVFGMVVVIHVFWRAFRWQHLLAMVPSGIMFLWYILKKPTLVEEGLVLGGLADWLQYKVYSVAKLGPYRNVFIDGTGDLTQSPALFWVGVAVNLAFAGFVALLIFQVFIRNRLTWLSDPAFVSAGIIIFAYPLMPTTVSGVVNIGERFLTIGVIMTVMLAALGPLRWTLSIGAAIAAFILPMFVMFLIAVTGAEKPREMVPGETIIIAEEGRLERLFWTRAFQGKRRLEDMARVREDGLSAAAPLDFKTSLIGPIEETRAGTAPAPSSPEDAAPVAN